MNCRTCQYDLSQCLDGRLPSGRHKIVMEHVDECGRCWQFWSELRRAQQLTQQLPRQRTDQSFREQLFARIDTGEGTPAAVFLEPIPAAKKIRYVMTGAAAAAAVLVTATLARRGFDAAQDPSTKLVASGPELPSRTVDGAADSVDQNPGQFIANYEPSPINNLLGAAKPLTVDLFANEAAKQLAEHVSWAKDSLNRLEADAQEVRVRALCEKAVEIKRLCALLVEMHEREQVVFSDPQVNIQMRFAVEQFGANAERLRLNTIDTVRTVVGPVLRSSNRLDDVVRIFVRQSSDDQTEENAVLALTQSQPEAFQSLFFVLPDNTYQSFAPLGTEVLLPGQCGPMFCVAPRSEVNRQALQWRQLQRLMGSMPWADQTHEAPEPTKSSTKALVDRQPESK